MTDFHHNSPASAPAAATGPVSSRYSPLLDRKVQDANWRKLRALAALLGLTPTEIARAAGCSRPYASRVMSQRDSFVASPAFWRRLEARLGTLVENRTSQVFAVAVVPVDASLEPDQRVT